MYGHYFFKYPCEIIYRFTCAVCGKKDESRPCKVGIGGDVEMCRPSDGWNLIMGDAIVCPDHVVGGEVLIDGKAGEFYGDTWVQRAKIGEAVFYHHPVGRDEKVYPTDVTPVLVLAVHENQMLLDLRCFGIGTTFEVKDAYYGFHEGGWTWTAEKVVK